MCSPSRYSIALCGYSKYVALLMIGSLLLWSVGFPGFMMRASAAQVQSLTDTLSNSAPGVAANHTIHFVTPTGIAADGTTMVVTFPDGFDISSITDVDVDIADNGTDLTTGAACGAVDAAVTVSGQLLTFEICNGGGGAIAPGDDVTIEVGTNATSSGSGSNRVINHASAGSYQLDIGGTMVDDGTTRLVIVETIQVTGAVETYLSMSIDGTDAGVTVNGDLTPTTGTTTATSVAFGWVQPNTPYVLAQDLRVTTNAVIGFAVTVETVGDLISDGGSTIDSFKDGAGLATPTTWAGPTATPGITSTYGHWGVTTDDATLSDDDSFGTALYAGNFVNAPREVMYATSSADGSTPDIGRVRVGYRLQTSSMQEAGTNYQTRLMYILTPTF